ncbi:MAG: hypothetical protein EBR81_11420 [Proteobacteria bacterium]|nr:hypothetical protein [Pseudomonadota bacterium]
MSFGKLPPKGRERNTALLHDPTVSDPPLNPFHFPPMKIRSHLPSLIVAVLAVFPFETEAAPLTLRQDDTANTISVFRQNVAEPILTQNARPDFRPFLHPIVAPEASGARSPVPLWLRKANRSSGARFITSLMPTVPQ